MNYDNKQNATHGAHVTCQLLFESYSNPTYLRLAPWRTDLRTYDNDSKWCADSAEVTMFRHVCRCVALSSRKSSSSFLEMSKPKECHGNGGQTAGVLNVLFISFLPRQRLPSTITDVVQNR